MSQTYIEDGCLTDDAILTTDLIKKCVINTTAQRMVPSNLNMKDSDTYDYYTKNLRVMYPNTAGSTGIIIPDVCIHHETFNHFGKTGVYVAIPLRWTQAIETKLLNTGMKPLFEDTGLQNTDQWWWTRFGSVEAVEGDEFIFSIDDDEETGEIFEVPFQSFPKLFDFTQSSVVANITCTVKMTAKVLKTSSEGITKDTQWRMGLNINRINVMDVTDDLEKPRTSLTQKSIPGKKDVASARLKAKLRAMSNK